MATGTLKSMGEGLPSYPVLKGKDPDTVMNSTATIVILIKNSVFTEKGSGAGSFANPKSLHYLHPKKVEVAHITSNRTVSLNLRHKVQKGNKSCQV